MKYVGFIVMMLATACLIHISGFALPTTIALSILILAITADFYTTWRCLKERGKEGNPMVAFLFKRIGLRASFGLMAGFFSLPAGISPTIWSEDGHFAVSQLRTAYPSMTDLSKAGMS